MSLNSWVTKQLQDAVQPAVFIRAAGKKAAVKARAVKNVAKSKKDREQPD